VLATFDLPGCQFKTCIQALVPPAFISGLGGPIGVAPGTRKLGSYKGSVRRGLEYNDGSCTGKTTPAVLPINILSVDNYFK